MKNKKIRLPDRRSDCPLNSWLEIFGDKWTMLIIRDIVAFGKSSFKEFMDSNENIASNILADRLKKLVKYGIISKTIDPAKKTSFRYSITPRGMELASIFRSIDLWSQKHIYQVRSGFPSSK